MAKTMRDRFLREYPEALADDAGTLFVGAGVSMAAGYPSWTKLLQEIGEELGVASNDVHDLAALAQWSIQESGGATRVRNVIREHIGQNRPVPPALQTIARLPVRHIWTTNYDRLIERAFDELARPLNSISGPRDLALRATPGAVRLYKMHGSVDRLDDLVISTDDYELFRSKRGAYLPLLQAHLTSMSMLFVGLSFTDPNVKHVLSLIRESFTEAPPEHFAIVRPPHEEDDFKTTSEFKTKAAQHAFWAKDLRRYGLNAVEIDDYREVPELLTKIERIVAFRRVWVSGSWPVGVNSVETEKVMSVAEGVGRWIGSKGRALVNGSGLSVGAAVVGGFLDELRRTGGWDLERRLIVRPFPPARETDVPDHELRTALRKELARLAGIVVFVGGVKDEGGALVVANGVLEEESVARAAGAFLLPVGATGGAANQIANSLLGSDLPSEGPNASRPTDRELQALLDSTADPSRLIATIETVLNRVTQPPAF